jgi:hypothetical protein
MLPKEHKDLFETISKYVSADDIKKKQEILDLVYSQLPPKRKIGIDFPVFCMVWILWSLLWVPANPWGPWLQVFFGITVSYLAWTSIKVLNKINIKKIKYRIESMIFKL